MNAYPKFIEIDATFKLLNITTAVHIFLIKTVQCKSENYPNFRRQGKFGMVALSTLLNIQKHVHHFRRLVNCKSLSPW